MSIEESLASYLLNTEYDAIPLSVIEATKAQMINMISAAIGGSSANGIRELVEVLSGWGGTPESTLIAYGNKLPAPLAAQANASMAHALDFDDTYNKITVHVAAVTVPPAIAIAEARGNISGKELLTSVTLAVDLGCRMATVLQVPKGEPQTGWHYWHFTTLFGYFMAAAAAGRLLKLNPEQMMNALGLAYHQAAGNMQVIREGALAKRLGPGFASRAGVEAALLAEKGVTGAKQFIEGEVGFYSLYHPTSKYCDLKKLTDGLGQKFENEDVSLKPYPCGVVNHTAIEAALSLAREFDINPADVSEIKVYTGAGTYVLCRPLEVKRHPKNTVGTQFSIPWAVATALAKRKASIEDFTDEATKDPVVNALTDKLFVELDPSFTGATIEPARVSVILENGRELVRQVEYPSGSPQKPFIAADIRNKLANCNSVSIKPFSDEKLDKLIETVANLEDLNDIDALVTGYI
jgi:2-methylcitrate dehydratase PrpD